MEKYKLKITADGESEWTNFSVLDGNKNLVAQETGSFSLELPKGLYSILEESQNTINREIVILNGDKTYTSKKLSDYSSDNQKISGKEYLTAAHEQSIKIPSKTPGSTNELSPLFIFMNVDSDDFEDSWLSIKDHINIINRDLKPLRIGEDAKWNVDTEEGWLSYHHLLSPGKYYLAFQGQESRILPFELFKNNQTKIFISFNKEPNFEDFRMNLSPLNYNKPGTNGDKSFAIALNKLNNKDYTVSEKILKELAFSKWKNPIYGLVVAYIYLKSHSHNFDNLFNNVVNNLENKILFSKDSTDIKLIKFLNEIHNKQNVDNDIIYSEIPQFETPPIFRVGMETLIELSFEYPDIIKKDSIIDLISDRLYYDIPWTSFRPFEEKDDYVNFFQRSLKPKVKKIDFPEFSDESPDDFNKVKFIEYTESDEFEEIGDEEGLFNLEIKNLNEWIDESKNTDIPDSLLDDLLPIIDIYNRNSSKGQLSLENLARTLGVPPITLKRKINAIQRFLNKNDRSDLNKKIESFIEEKKITLDINTKTLNDIYSSISQL